MKYITNKSFQIFDMIVTTHMNVVQVVVVWYHVIQVVNGTVWDLIWFVFPAKKPNGAQMDMIALITIKVVVVQNVSLVITCIMKVGGVV